MRCFALLVGSSFFVACFSTPEPAEQKEVLIPPAEEVEKETAAEEVKQEPVEEQAEVIDTPEPAAEPEPEPEPAEEPQNDIDEEFLVSEEVFTETFEDIRLLIDELNSIVRAENYDEWLKYLTEEYIAHFSSPDILKENSEQPLLKKYNIKLESLLDYFKNVVVPSRSNARLDDLVFVDNEHVKAIMVFNNKRTILYLLEKGENGWKIGL